MDEDGEGAVLDSVGVAEVVGPGCQVAPGEHYGGDAGSMMQQGTGRKVGYA